MTVYIAMAFTQNSPGHILGVFREKSKAEEAVYKSPCTWVNVVEMELQ